MIEYIYLVNIKGWGGIFYRDYNHTHDWLKYFNQEVITVEYIQTTTDSEIYKTAVENSENYKQITIQGREIGI